MDRRTNGLAAGDTAIPVDLHRAIVFPNRLRELRRERGHAKLLHLSALIPDIPYIRLSKIERGEVVARPEELRRIAAALGTEPEALLIDVDDPDFDIARWSEPFQPERAPDLGEEQFAVLLAAAVRARRASDAALSIAAIERDYGLPPVNLSRVENAAKPFARWNAAVRGALLRLFRVSDEAALRAEVARLHAAGTLAPYLEAIAGPEDRHERTRARIFELALALQEPPADAPPPPPMPMPEPRRLAVIGAPLPGGLISAAATGDAVEAPANAGPRAFALRMGRATLGGGLPAHATLIADPDRFPAAGGIAAVREDNAWRVLAVTAERDGRLVGYSVHPAIERDLDSLDPADVATVIAATFV